MAFEDRSFMGYGDIWFNRQDENGNKVGFVKLGNADSFSLQAASEIKEQKSYMKADYGSIRDSVALPQPNVIKANLKDFTPENLAMGLMGTVEAIAVNADPVANESHTVVSVGKALKLANRNVSSVVVKDNGVGEDQVTFVKDTDYTETDLALGFITPKVGGAITAGTVLLISYGKAAQTGYKINGGTQSVIKGEVFFDGVNKANGRPVQVTVPEVTWAPNSDVALIGEEYGSIALDGKANKLDSESAIYYIEYLD